ncbi:MAG: beta strand repeat-containing protein [Boseongicola sp.]
MPVFVTIAATAGSTDIGDSLATILNAGTLTFINSTTVTVGTGPNDLVTLAGTGFAASGGNLTAGSIDSAVVTQGGTSIGTYSNLATDAVTFWNAVLDLKGGNAATLDALSDSLEYDFTGNITADTFEGGILDDIIRGGGGADTLIGWDGNDVLAGGGGADFMDGGAGFDALAYTNSGAAVTVNLALGTASGGQANGDTFANIEQVFGSAFNDSLTGGSGDERFRGNDGVDSIDGGTGFDESDFRNAAGAVTATFTGGGTLSVANDGFGNAETHLNIESVRGWTGNDVFTGSGGNERFRGLAGDDQLSGGGGIDSLDYRRDEDNGGTMGVIVDLTLPTATDGFGDTDTISGFENVFGTRFDDAIFGDGGANFLTGRNGNDFFVGRAGADTLDGGDGSDTSSYAGSGAGVTVFLDSGSGSTTSGGGAAGDTLISIENLTGSAFRDILIGNDDANTFIGGTGDDDLGGGNGDDTLTGGDGTDVLVGGAGADAMDGGSGFDIAFFLGSSTGVTIDLAGGTGAGGEAQGDTFTSVETVIASTSDDTIIGSAAANTLIGRDGADTFFGSAGGDILIGGDSVAVDTNTSDLVDYSTAATSAEIAVNLGNNSAQGLDIGSDQLFGIEDVSGSNFGDLLRGDAMANDLTGLGGGDLILGGGGNDGLDGGGGDDFITGEGGNDAFVFNFNDGNTGNDIIIDFDQNGDDTLLFLNFGVNFDFSDFTLTTVNVNDVLIQATGWSGTAVLQGADGMVEAGDFSFA